MFNAALRLDGRRVLAFGLSRDVFFCWTLLQRAAICSGGHPALRDGVSGTGRGEKGERERVQGETVRDREMDRDTSE